MSSAAPGSGAQVAPRLNRTSTLRALSSPAAAAWLVIGLTVLAFGLRWACLRQSLFGDELFLYEAVHGRSLGQVFHTLRESEKTPPLGFVLAWLTGRGGSADVLVRLPSFVAGVATVPLVYLLGSRTMGRAAGLLAAAWFALSPFEIFYGTEARGYAIVAALVVTSTLALLAALEQSRARWWVLYALAATAAVYTHYIAALTLIPQAAWALWTHRERARELLIANGAVVLAFLPWVPSFLLQARHSSDEAKRLSLLSPLTLSNVEEAVGKALAGHPFVALREIPGRSALAVLAILLVSVAVALGFQWARQERRAMPRAGSPATLLALLALFPLAAIVLYSLQPDTSFLLARNLSVAVPYALVLFGWLLTRPRPEIAVALSVVALAAVGVGAVRTLSPDHQRPDARGAARYIDANASPNVPVVVELPFPFRGAPARATQVYLRRPHRIFKPAAWPFAWAIAARTGAPVFVTLQNIPALLRLYRPPPQYTSRYRLVARHLTRGITPLVVVEYAPRR